MNRTHLLFFLTTSAASWNLSAKPVKVVPIVDVLTIPSLIPSATNAACIAFI